MNLRAIPTAHINQPMTTPTISKAKWFGPHIIKAEAPEYGRHDVPHMVVTMTEQGSHWAIMGALKDALEIDLKRLAHRELVKEGITGDKFEPDFGREWCIRTTTNGNQLDVHLHPPYLVDTAVDRAVAQAVIQKFTAAINRVAAKSK